MQDIITRDARILFVGAAFPPSVGGSAVVMRELLKQLDPCSYNIITLKAAGSSQDAEMESRTFRAGTRKIRPYNLGLWVRFLQMPFVLRGVCDFAMRCKSNVVVCVYPTIDFLFLGYLMARRTGLPLVVYMHDTLLEAHKRTSFRFVAKWLHRALRCKVSMVFSMSEGMRDFYRDKYGLDSVVLPHIYPEAVNMRLSSRVARQLFWGGAVYGINDKALCRVLMAAKKVGVKLTLTGKDKAAICRRLGEPMDGESIEVKYYEKRSDYLAALIASGVMVLALNKPSETEYGEGEISTIFPTKTPEYLASGMPILVHCPKEYFLARFFEKHNCGLVISDDNIETIASAINKLCSNDEEVVAMRENALRAANIFSPRAVCSAFDAGLNKVISGC